MPPLQLAMAGVSNLGDGKREKAPQQPYLQLGRMNGQVVSFRIVPLVGPDPPRRAKAFAKSGRKSVLSVLRVAPSFVKQGLVGNKVFTPISLHWCTQVFMPRRRWTEPFKDALAFIDPVDR